MYICIIGTKSLADPGGGAHPARAPPNGRRIFFYAQNAIFLIFFFARDEFKA